MRSNLYFVFVLLIGCLFFADASISDLIAADDAPAEKKGKKGADSSTNGKPEAAKKGQNRVGKRDHLGVEPRFLDQDALVNLFLDSTISHVNPRSGADVLMSLHADGTLSGSSTQRSGKTASIDGNWSVSPRGAFCFSSEQQGMLCVNLVRLGIDTLWHQ
jgi:hypothetical protein